MSNGQRKQLRSGMIISAATLPFVSSVKSSILNAKFLALYIFLKLNSNVLIQYVTVCFLLVFLTALYIRILYLSELHKQMYRRIQEVRLQPRLLGWQR